jgi:hypothetical protein
MFISTFRLTKTEFALLGKEKVVDLSTTFLFPVACKLIFFLSLVIFEIQFVRVMSMGNTETGWQLKQLSGA